MFLDNRYSSGKKRETFRCEISLMLLCVLHTKTRTNENNELIVKFDDY